MSRRKTDTENKVEEHSGWVVPLALVIITASLGSLVYAYYFVSVSPGMGVELPSPTDSPLRISFNLGGAKYRVPANYLPLASSRTGGQVEEIRITALLPDLSGFSLGIAAGYGSNARDSHAVHVNLRAGVAVPTEEERFRRIYTPQLEDEIGSDGPADLHALQFRASSGYSGQDLFSGIGQNGLVTILCDKPGPGTPSPNCIRDYPLPNGLTLNYRFKREHLAGWIIIDKGVRAMIAGFEDKGEEAEPLPPAPPQ